MARRVKEVRARARVARWHYRQRDLADGAWHRFRLVLARAREAYEIDDATAQQLIAEGCTVDNGAAALEPARTLIWVSPARAACLVGARPVALRLDAALLAARCLALVAF